MNDKYSDDSQNEVEKIENEDSSVPPNILKDGPIFNDYDIENGGDVRTSTMGRIEGLSFIKNLKATMKITSLDELLSSSFAVGVSSGALFFSFVLLVIVISQFFGGVTPRLLEMFPNGYNLFSQIDKNFGGAHTVSLLTMFLPLFLVLLYFELSIFENYLDNILGKRQSSSPEAKLALYWQVLTLMAVPFAGSQLFTLRYTFLGIFNSSFGRFGIFLPLLQIVVTILSISFVYRCFSKGSFSWRTSLFSGAIAGVLFEVTKYITLYLTRVKMESSQISDYIVILVILAVWFFVSALVYCFCAKIAYYYEYRELYVDANAKILSQSNSRATREIALICLLEMTKKFYSNKEQICSEKVGMRINEICEVAVITPERARSVISHLHKVSLLRVLRDKDEDVAVINFSPDSLTLEEFIFRIEEKFKDLGVPLLPNCPANKWFWDEYRQSIKKSFSGMNLKDLYKMKFPEIG